MPIIPAPAARRVHAFPSSGFFTRRPAVMNEQLIPPKVRTVLETVWSRDVFPGRDGEVFLLPDVTVAAEGLVFDRALDLYAPSVTQHAPAEIAAAERVLRWIGPTRRHQGRTVLCVKRGAANYGHWLMEMLPKAYMVRRFLPHLAERFAVPDAPPPLREVILDSMAMIGIPPERLLFLDGSPAWFEELVLLDGLTEHGGYMSPRVLDCTEHVAAVPAEGSGRLYVSRAGSGVRVFAREAEVEQAARSVGYEVVHPELLPFRAQVARFKGASRIAGVMGAGLANIAFAAPGARVAAFAPAAMSDTFFWFIASLRGHRYLEVRCPQTGPARGPSPWDTDLDLAPEAFAAVLRALD